MADKAVSMAEAGCDYITVLSVDYMSDNVRAILDQAGFKKVGVYRMSNEELTCSSADAAASPTYMHFLETASRPPPYLHVIYINTSLETKAQGHELVPTTPALHLMLCKRYCRQAIWKGWCCIVHDVWS